MSKSKIVDLEVGSDGTYSEKANKVKIDKARPVMNYKKQKNHMVPAGADEFLGGLDAGLDFVDAIKSRALRILSLRD